jgi:hypothetical protein
VRRRAAQPAGSAEAALLAALHEAASEAAAFARDCCARLGLDSACA